jgi:hypothetical protein
MSHSRISLSTKDWAYPVASEPVVQSDWVVAQPEFRSVPALAQ